MIKTNYSDIFSLKLASLFKKIKQFLACKDSVVMNIINLKGRFLRQPYCL